MLASGGHVSAEEMACRAVLVYAVYMATNHFRACGGASFEVSVDAIIQFCKNAARGHAGCSRALDSRWVLVDEDGSVAGMRKGKRVASTPSE